MADQIGGPVEAARLEEPGGEIARPVFGQDGVDESLRGGIGCAAERQRDRAKPQLEQPIAAPRLQVVVAFRRRLGDQFDLPVVEAEALVGGPRLRLDRPVIGQKNTLRAALDDGRSNPFSEAYAILAKTMSEASLKQVAAVISAKKVQLTPEEARDLARRAVKFKQERGRLPEITSPDPWEKKMAEGVAFLARMKAEAAHG